MLCGLFDLSMFEVDDTPPDSHCEVCDPWEGGKDRVARNGAGMVLALVLESRFWSLLCLRWKWCWRLCLGRGRRRARVGTSFEVLVAVVIVLELVLVPAFRSMVA